MATRRPAPQLVILSIVLGMHLIVVWLFVSSSRLSVKTKAGSLQLVWIAPPAPSETALQTTTHGPTNGPPRHRTDRTPALPSIGPPSNEEDNAIHPAPDWTAELHLAAKNALANELARKRHESDFAHAYPTPAKKPPQFAWNDAAIHRVQALPQGGMLIHLGNNCVLVLMPLPMVGCGIGKAPANGDLFQHSHD
jgi:hypothetical protein